MAEQLPRTHLELELDVRTGTRLNDRDELEVLSPETWKRLKTVAAPLREPVAAVHKQCARLQAAR